MENAEKSIRYCFKLPGGAEEIFDLTMDVRTSALVGIGQENPPPWTRLDFEQCSVCPLAVDSTPICPAASSLVDMAGRFDTLASFNEIDLVIEIDEKTIFQKTTAQRGIRSLMGLILAASGCPMLEFLRPLARFHQPLPTPEGTFVRAVSMYLLAQYFVSQTEHPPDFELVHLKKHYENLQIVNAALANRLRAAVREDATINAIILLDTYATSIPDMIETSLRKLKYLFEGYGQPKHR